MNAGPTCVVETILPSDAATLGYLLGAQACRSAVVS